MIFANSKRFATDKIGALLNTVEAAAGILGSTVARTTIRKATTAPTTPSFHRGFDAPSLACPRFAITAAAQNVMYKLDFPATASPTF